MSARGTEPEYQLVCIDGECWRSDALTVNVGQATLATDYRPYWAIAITIADCNILESERRLDTP
jgi:hypothetical protein